MKTFRLCRVGWWGILLASVAIVATVPTSVADSPGLPAYSSGGSVAAVLRADYQLMDSFESATSGVPALTPLGPVTFGDGTVDGVSRRVLNFAVNDGVSLSPFSSVVSGSSYSIVALFAFNEVSRWRRILDFKNATSDTGLYSYQGALNFYNEALGPGAPIAPGAFVQVVLTRDSAQNVAGYVDGISQFNFVDATSLALVDSVNVLRFFRDEDPIFPGEASPGVLARLRVYEGALTASEVAALDRLGETPPASIIQFSPVAYAADEGEGSIALSVIRTGTTNASAQVEWSPSGGTATVGVDWDAPTSVQLSFAPGETIKSIVLTVLEDVLAEGAETVILQLGNPTGATLSHSNVATLTIIDNDTNAVPTSIEFVASSIAGPVEGFGSRAIVGVRRQGSSDSAVSVSWRTGFGSATAGEDFLAASGTLIFPSGVSTQTITIQTLDDFAVEPVEYLTVQLSDPVNAALGTISNAFLFLYDNDLPVQVAFGTTAQIVTETNGPAYLRIERLGNVYESFTVEWAITSGTATSPSDFTGPTSGTVSFPSGTVFQDLALQLVDDLLVETNETISVVLLNPAGATLGFPSASTLIIADNDSDPCLPSGLGIPAYLGTFPASSNSASYPVRLSQIGAFDPTADLTPVATLIPYDVNTPLWSDAALKRRWFGIPQNTQIIFNSTGSWTFPNGSIFVKHFDLEINETTHATRRLETRFIVTVPGAEKVYGLTYRWDPSNAADAFLVSTEGMDDDIVITGPTGNRTQRWRYPSQAQCLECHTPSTGGVLGVNTRQMNRVYAYGPECPPVNQIQAAQFRNRFSNIVPAPSTLPAQASITDTNVDAMRRFRSYMDANCAHCHRPGSARDLFDARYDVAPLTMLSGEDPKVYFRDWNGSILFTRDSALVPGGGIQQMPPLAKRLNDDTWLAFLKEFITDSFNPLYASVCGPGSNQIVVRFNRPIEPTSGAMTNHYTLDGHRITAATVAADTVTLTIDPALAHDAGEQTLMVNNVRDRHMPSNTNWPAFELKFTPFAPANDDLANATGLGGPPALRKFAATVCATKQTDEPQHAANPGGKSIWWTWTAPADGILYLDTEGADFDTLLAVYTGGGLNALTLIQANDDAQPPMRWSSVSLPVESGTAYRIAIDGYDGASGETALNLEFQEFLDPLDFSIVLLSPAEGAVIPSGPNVVMNAHVNTRPGQLSSLEYFGDGGLVARDPSGATNSFALWPFVVPGSHSLLAVATATNGSRTSNEIFFTAIFDSTSNRPPVAFSDSVGVEAGAITPVFVLGNDYDPDSDSLHIVTCTQPASGRVLSHFEEPLLYAPNPDFTGVDFFTYTISDEHGGSSTGEVHVTVTNGTPRMHSLRGTITATNGIGLSNVIVSLRGDRALTLVTDAEGSYHFPNLPSGNYTVEPFLSGATFYPRDSRFTPLAADVEADFTVVDTSASVVQFGHGEFAVLESTGVTSITVERVGNLNWAMTVGWSVVAATATANSDYQFLTHSGQLNFAPGENSQSILVELLDDAEVESIEWFSLSLHGSTNGVVGSNGSLTLTIYDDDDAPQESPTLNVACFEGYIVLTWPARFEGFALEAADRLTPPIQWQPLFHPIEITGSQYRLALPKQGEDLFVRLAKTDPVPAVDVDIDVDTDRSDAIENEGDETDEDKPVKYLQDKGALVLVNCDADRTDRKPGDDKRDIDDRVISGQDDENDMSPISLELKRDLAQDEVLMLTLLAFDAAGKPDPKVVPPIRLMDKRAGKNGHALIADGRGSRLDGAKVMGDTDDKKLFPGGKKQRYDGRFLLEGFRFATEVELKLLIYNTRTRKTVAQDVVRVATTPWLANHPKQPMADTDAWQIPGNLPNSQSFPFDKAYGSKRIVAGASLEFVQDGVEWGYQLRRHKTAANGRAMIAALRLYTEREDEHALKFAGSKVGVFGWHKNDDVEDYYEFQGQNKAGDQGGNLECLPPMDRYPFGRIVHGDFMSAKLKLFLQRQGVQYGLELKLKDLGFPHVDEMIAIVPKKEGWIVLMPDWDSGRAILAANLKLEVNALRIVPGGQPGVLKTYREILDYIDNKEAGKAWTKKYREGMAAVEKHLKDEGVQVLRLPGMFFETPTPAPVGGAHLRGWPRNIANSQVINPHANDPGILVISQPLKLENNNEDPFLVAWKMIFQREKIIIGLQDMTAAWQKGGEAHCSSNGIREPMKK